MSVRLQSRFARIGGYLRKFPQPFPRYRPALCSFVTVPTKCNQIRFFNPQIKVLGKRNDVVNRQAAVNEQAALKANPTAVLIPFENKPRGAFPSLRIAEFIGLRSSRNVVVERLAMPRVNAPADRAKTFYLVIHTTIIPHLNRTKRTTFRVYQKISCKPCERSPRYSCRRFQPQLCASS